MTCLLCFPVNKDDENKISGTNSLEKNKVAPLFGSLNENQILAPVYKYQGRGTYRVRGACET
jgi:hypothetical protein